MIPTIHVTNLEYSSSTLESQWGAITYLEWCRRESERMRAHGARTLVLEEGDRCCIARIDNSALAT